MSYLIENGDIYTPRTLVENGRLLMRGHFISGVFAPGEAWKSVINEDEQVTHIDAQGGVVIPGFIDLHVHGGGGADITDETPESIDKIVQFHLNNGTTGLLLSTMSGTTYDELKRQVDLIGKSMEIHDSLVGIHLEGPYLNPKYAGMYPPETFRIPRIEECEELNTVSDHHIRMITIAPELENALDLISYCAQHGIVASLGHSNADYEMVMKAITLGVSHVTHVCNAMPPLHHRAPGVLGASLMDDRLSVQVICDGIHLHPLIVKMILRLKGAHQVCLVTDAMRAAGMPEGDYMLGKFMKVHYRNGYVTSDNGSLSSSPLSMLQAFRNILAFGDISFSQAIHTVSTTPSRVLGLGNYIGALEEGYDADVLILDRELNIQHIFLKGKLVK